MPLYFDPYEVVAIGLLIAAAVIFMAFVLTKLEFSFPKYKDASTETLYRDFLESQRRSKELNGEYLCQRDANFNDEKNSLELSDVIEVEEQNIYAGSGTCEDRVDAAIIKVSDLETTEVNIERSANRSKGLEEAFCECEMCVKFDSFKCDDETWMEQTNDHRRLGGCAHQTNYDDGSLDASGVESTSHSFRNYEEDTLQHDMDISSRRHHDYPELNVHDLESRSNSWDYINKSVQWTRTRDEMNTFGTSQQTEKSSTSKFDLADYEVCKEDTGNSYKYCVTRNSGSPVSFNIKKDVKIPEPENVQEYHGHDDEAFGSKLFPLLRSLNRETTWLSKAEEDASKRLSTYSETSAYSNESTIPSEFTCRTCEPIEDNPSVAMATNFYSTSKRTSSTMVSSMRTQSSRLATESGYMSSGGDAGTSGSEVLDPNESWMDRYKSQHRRMLMRHHKSYVVGKKRIRRYLGEKMRLATHVGSNENKLDPPVPHPPEALSNVQRRFGRPVIATWKELVKSRSQSNESLQNESFKDSLGLLDNSSYTVKQCKIRRKRCAKRKLRVNVDFAVNPTGSSTEQLSGAMTLPVTCSWIKGQGHRIVSVGRPVLRNER